jgi:5-deoxy-glucuronate isomerase
MTRPAHPCLIPGPLAGFADGATVITRTGEPEHDTGMSFCVLRLQAGEAFRKSLDREAAWLLVDGEVQLSADGVEATAKRSSIFDEDPTVLHVPSGSEALVLALSEAELVLVETDSDWRFPPQLFGPGSLAETEHRGRGWLDDTAYRIVRTVFDRRNRPEAALVLGEVVCMPGRWSSYPPHHHPQPEIYHYRFDRPQGYGHAELGETVLRVQHGDTVKILDDHDHPQVAAPGYRMYYLWVIRHLPGEPYTVPEFTEAHRWLLGS